MEVLTYIGYILLALLSLCIMIVVHELGHYTVGRLLGFKILEFGIGFGPPIFKKEKNGILYTIRPIPLGGFCKFYGEDGEDEAKEPVKGAMNSMPAWKRACVLAAGVVFNLLLALILSIGIFGIGGDTVYTVKDVTAGQPSYAVLQKGDALLRVDGQMIIDGTELSRAINRTEGNGESIILTIERDGKRENVEIVPERYVREENGETVTAVRIGVSMSSVNYRFPIGEVFERAFNYCAYMADAIFDAVEGMIRGSIGLNEMGGPITTVQTMADATRDYGFAVLLRLMVMLSVNLAIFNILPFPALDGARIVFVIFYSIAEKIAGKKLSHTAEGYIHTAGLLILFAFVIVIEVLHFTAG